MQLLDQIIKNYKSQVASPFIMYLYIPTEQVRYTEQTGFMRCIKGLLDVDLCTNSPLQG